MLETNAIIRARVVELRRDALYLASGDHRFYTSPAESLREGERWREAIQIGDGFDVLVAILGAKGRSYYGRLLERDDYEFFERLAE